MLNASPIRRASICLGLALVLTACPVTPPPDDQDGGGGGGSSDQPPFIITSPTARSSISGPIFFAVQPLDPDEVESVEFQAGNKMLEADSPGEDRFKVFLLPGEFPDGPLNLTASVTGTDGSRSTRSIEVDVVADPPSTATVGPDGAVLGTREDNGAMSVLNVPAGVAEGATISFAARSQDEIKQDTGVDYEALGVTFLGAQEIDSSAPLGETAMVSSGGFGPMVQPGQAVVQYTIAPDADGDGAGELVVANTASVAPNGDVVSNPPPGVQVAREAQALIGGSVDPVDLEADPSEIAPGSFLSLATVGLNPYAPLGNVAVFYLPARNEYATATISVRPAAGGGEHARLLVPSLPAGRAQLFLVNISQKTVSRAVKLDIKAPEPLERSLSEVYAEFFGFAIESVAANDDLPDATKAMLTADLASVRADFMAALELDLQQETREELAAIASMLEAMDLAKLDDEALAAFGDMLQDACDFPWASAAHAGITTSLAVGATVAASLASAPALAVVGGLGTIYGIGSVAWNFVQADIGLIETATGVGGMSSVFASEPAADPAFWKATARVAGYAGAAMSINEFSKDLGYYSGCPDIAEPRPTPRPARVTGMGAAPPPGGNAAGYAGNSTAGAPGDPAIEAQQGLPSSISVKVFTGATAAPFTGVTDSSGYFYIPLIPEGQPFTAVATDPESGEIKTLDGVGPAPGENALLVLDFSTGTETDRQIAVDSNTPGTIEAGANEPYAFTASAGDVVRLALHSDERNVGDVIVTLIAPSGDVVFGTNRLSQHDHFHVIPEQELSEDGTYTVLISNETQAAFDYTLGVALVDEPTLLDPAETGVAIADELDIVGDVHYYAFEAEPGDAAKVAMKAVDGAELTWESFLVRPSDGRTILGHQGAIHPGISEASYGPVPLWESGAYLLAIKAVDGGSRPVEAFVGGYEVSLRKPDTGQQSIGSSVSGVIEAGDLNAYTYQGAAGDVVTVAAIREPVAHGSAYDMTLEQAMPGGAFVTRRLHGGTSFRYATLGEQTFDGNTAPTVVVNSVDAAATGYSLGIAPVEAPTPIALTPPVTSTSGTVDIIGEVTQFSFKGEANQEYGVTLHHSSDDGLHAMAELYTTNASGEPQSRQATVSTNASTRSATADVTLPESGTYLIVVKPGSGVTGSLPSMEAFTGAFDVTLELR